MWKITILPPEGEPGQHELAAESTVIGRAPECDIVVNDSFLSREHARFFVEKGALFVEDLGSSNGTLLNGSIISQPTEVSAGDVVNVSKTHISVSDSTAQDAGAAPEGVTALRPLSELLPHARREGEGSDEPHEDLRRYAERLDFLNEIHRELGAAAELERLFERVLEGISEHLGPENAVILLKNEAGELEAAASSGSTDGEQPISQTLIEEVVERGQAALAVDVQADQRFAKAKSIISTGARSLLAAPLLDTEGSLGMIALSSSLQTKVFTEEDMELLASLASVAALRIRNLSLTKKNAQRERLEREIALARQVQERLLPSRIPELSSYAVAAENKPSRGVSGDIYQIAGGEEAGECVLAIADVCGKGIAASLLSVAVDAAWSILIDSGERAPDRIFKEANALLHRKTPPDKFATAFLAVADLDSGDVRYANAGHNPPLLIRTDGAVEELPATGFPLAMVPDAEYDAATIHLEPGDLLLMFTDGIVEPENPDREEFGLDRLVEVVMEDAQGPAEAILARIDRELEHFVEGVPFVDDRTLLLLRRLSD